jgi:hypothetical protein
LLRHRLLSSFAKTFSGAPATNFSFASLFWTDFKNLAYTLTNSVLILQFNDMSSMDKILSDFTRKDNAPSTLSDTYSKYSQFGYKLNQNK